MTTSRFEDELANHFHEGLKAIAIKCREAGADQYQFVVMLRQMSDMLYHSELNRIDARAKNLADDILSRPGHA